MNPPPPLPDERPLPVESGFKTYGFAFAILFPVVFLFIFSNLVIVPKLERIWTAAGLESSSAWWLMGTVRLVFDNGKGLIGIGLVLLLLMERFFAGWPARRRAVVLFVTVVINSAMLIALTFATLSVLLAAPLLAGKLKKASTRHEP